MIRLKKTLALIATTLCLSFTTGNAQAENKISLGAAIVWVSSPYKGHDNTLLPLPVISWEAKHFYIRGSRAGVFLWTDDNEMNELSIGLGLGDTYFDHDKTSDHQLKRLDDRKLAVDGYLQYILRTQIGHLGARLSYDVFGNAEGFMADAFYAYPFQLGPVSIRPGAGIKWESEDRLNYYYGVSATESNKSGLARYQGDSGFSPYLSLHSEYQYNDNISIFASSQVRFLSSQIKDSPMIDDSNVINATFGARYSF